MTIELTDEQGSTLAGVLRDYVSNLRMEIGKTDSYAYRQSLKQQEELLQSVLVGLEAPRPGAYAA